MRRLVPLLLSLCAANARPKALFYLTATPRSVQSFIAHADKIDILVPTWYNVDAAGLVWGGPDELVMETARNHHVPVMPIVVNPGFNQENFHKLASSSLARGTMIGALFRECRKYGYAGIQFDFENILWTDGDLLTNLVREAAYAFHQSGLQLSIATVPNAPGYPGHGGFARWIYENWRGAYDLKALAEQVDLICLMTYGRAHALHAARSGLGLSLVISPKEKVSSDRLAPVMKRVPSGWQSSTLPNRFSVACGPCDVGDKKIACSRSGSAATNRPFWSRQADLGCRPAP
jgi:spore germination protein YaaH